MKLKGYPLNKERSYCISEIDSEEPIIYAGRRQYFRLKGAAVTALKEVERDRGYYFEVRQLISNRSIMEDKKNG